MKAAFYNPYFETLGGGELYTLRFAVALVKLGYRVDIQMNNPRILVDAGKRFNLDISGINCVGDIKRGDGYDLCFWVSDGSIPTLRSRNNILHFQIPFTGKDGRSLLNKMKIFRIKSIVCNSQFTKGFIDKEYGVNSTVVYPPCDVSEFNNKKNKKNIILYVGRFSTLMQSKGQEVLIKVFKKLPTKIASRWGLVLTGGSEVGAGNFVAKLRKMAKDFNIRIIESPTRTELIKLYSEAKLFWSASGFGINSQKNPEKVEHFGITLVEAMASGIIPLCYNAGGYKEVIMDGNSGFLWNDTNELIKKTTQIISDKKISAEIAVNAISRAKNFDVDSFNQSVAKLL